MAGKNLERIVKKAKFNVDEANEPERFADIVMECKPNDCGNRPNVTFRVIPEDDAGTVNWNDIIVGEKARGTIVAKYRLETDVPVTELGLTKKGDILYQWVGPLDPFNARGIALLRVDTEAWTGTLYRATQYFERCDDPRTNNPNKKSAVQKKNTHDKCFIEHQQDVPSLTAGTDPVEILVPSTVWVSCANGCCEAKQAGSYR
jgi:hypothetical protein